MKKLIIASLMTLVTTSSFAACFISEKEAAEKANLPQVICVESHSLELVTPELPRKPYLEMIVSSDLGSVSKQDVRLTPTADGLFAAKVRKTVTNQGGSCSRSRYTYIEFTLEVKEDLTPWIFTVTGYDATSADSCHSPWKETKIEYSAI